MSGSKRQAVKVVLIDTQYVETDQKSFKSVVQQLTGKDSCVAWIQGSSPKGAKTETLHNKQLEDNHVYSYDNQRGNDGTTASASILSKGMSFKDLDRLILELPVEDFSWLYNYCSTGSQC
ncbi:hypothetical protein Pint_09959 [Pistacia integerrima]|uniref:Uncharacterized protein n=1 Tax=Pistacia integerrima TaxID=434235 RepID=A0ACC0XHL0_9ROSI|nr:hypothetical protein Pint_09959 [Pistacia integerrima]